MLQTSARVERLSVYNFHSNALTWWKDLENRLTRLRNLSVWLIPSKQSQGLAVLVQRTMALQVTVQDGSVWVSDDTQSVEITLQRLRGPTED